jgi:hypothetical protein
VPVALLNPKIPQPVYKVGDYFTYKVEFSVTSQGQTCTIDFTYRLDIVKIEMNTVTSNQTIKDVKKTGACPGKPQLPFYEGEKSDSINKEPSETFSFLAIHMLPFSLIHRIVKSLESPRRIHSMVLSRVHH